MSRHRYRFVERSGRLLIWQAHIPNDSRVDQITCDAGWFYSTMLSRRYNETYAQVTRQITNERMKQSPPADALVQAYRRMEKEYTDRCDMIWDDMQFEFQMRHGLDDNSMEEIEERAR